jgi:hypothetical protein
MFSNNNANYRTNICTNFYVGCGYNKCGYAHNVEELLPRKCGYDGKCINERCNFYHSKDTLDKLKLWRNLIKNHLQYTHENDILNITKNTIKGFEPKTIDDINKVFDGYNKNSFIVSVNESTNDLNEIKIIKSNDIYNDMKDLEMADSINLIEEGLKKINLTCNIPPINPQINRYCVDFVCDKNQYTLITDFIRSLNVEYNIGFISK